MHTGLSVAALIGDAARSKMLLSLMGGAARPAGELARIASISPATASEHLLKLARGRLIIAEQRGRHRYYRLYDAEVAGVLETLLVLEARSATPAIRAEAGTLAHARTCYSHLAGWLGVSIAEALENRGCLHSSDASSYSITPEGRSWFEQLSIQLPASDHHHPLAARRCLDWTERRPHLGGTPGIALYRRLRELNWIAPSPNTRAIRVTVEGKARFWDLLRISLS